VARTWALVIAAAVLYIPANYYSVLMQLGAGQPSTILGGVEELVAARQYPLAALVFFASIAVPMRKLFGLSIMLITIQTGRTGWLRDRTRLYHIVRFIGRWSMIDIFMESLLGALVAFGSPRAPMPHSRSASRGCCSDFAAERMLPHPPLT
jgi:paraquat-inducible protein A